AEENIVIDSDDHGAKESVLIGMAPKIKGSKGQHLRVRDPRRDCRQARVPRGEVSSVPRRNRHLLAENLRTKALTRPGCLILPFLELPELLLLGRLGRSFAGSFGRSCSRATTRDDQDRVEPQTAQRSCFFLRKVWRAALSSEYREKTIGAPGLRGADWNCGVL